VRCTILAVLASVIETSPRAFTSPHEVLSSHILYVHFFNMSVSLLNRRLDLGPRFYLHRQVHMHPVVEVEARPASGIRGGGRMHGAQRKTPVHGAEWGRHGAAWGPSKKKPRETGKKGGGGGARRAPVWTGHRLPKFANSVVKCRASRMRTRC
jgi:hypothetical protein